MKSEEIIMLVFVGVIVTGIPTMLWYMHKERQREEQEERESWKKKRTQ